MRMRSMLSLSCCFALGACATVQPLAESRYLRLLGQSYATPEFETSSDPLAGSTVFSPLVTPEHASPGVLTPAQVQPGGRYTEVTLVVVGLAVLVFFIGFSLRD